MKYQHFSGKLGIGSRRNFIIRMKCGKLEDDLDGSDSRMNEIKIRCKEKRKTYDGEDYAFVHCTGYVPVSVTKLLIYRPCLLCYDYRSEQVTTPRL